MHLGASFSKFINDLATEGITAFYVFQSENTKHAMAAINKDRPSNLPKRSGDWADGFPTTGFPGFNQGTP
jgi:hypothetical protein